MDYENALREDFWSDAEELDAAANAEPSIPAVPAARHGPSAQTRPETRPQTLHDLLLQSPGVSVERRLQQVDVSANIPASELSQVQRLIPEIRAELEKHADQFETEYMDLVASIHDQRGMSAEHRFLADLSDLPALIQEEIRMLHRYVALRYKVVFSELEQLVASPVDYCRIVLEIGQDLLGIRSHEPQLRQIVSSERVLTIVMAALQQFLLAFELSSPDMQSIREACEACVELSSFVGEISRFVAGKLLKYAPNVALVVGPVAASQLLISTGSLHQLAQTPACNLASLGVRDLLAQRRAAAAPFVRATGYLYHCPLVVGLPPEIVKQALRIISAKVVLAARIDHARGSPDGAMGRKYRADIELKIDRLLAPPELATTKALPVPKEQKLKKRGGRRFRKMKERFQMSDLRKAQNKMLFGKQEQSVVDGFGEEVGLGMSHQIDSILVNRNTDARMSKAMVSRLQLQKQRDTLDTIVLAPVAEKRARDLEPHGEWGTMKRQKTEGHMAEH